MYMGEPQRVAAITPSCRKRAKPKSAVNESVNNSISQAIPPLALRPEIGQSQLGLSLDSITNRMQPLLSFNRSVGRQTMGSLIEHFASLFDISVRLYP